MPTPGRVRPPSLTRADLQAIIARDKPGWVLADPEPTPPVDRSNVTSSPPLWYMKYAMLGQPIPAHISGVFSFGNKTLVVEAGKIVGAGG